VRRLLTRCLDKDPRRRLSAIGDARFELDEPAAPPATVAPPSSRASLRPMLFGAAAGMLVAAGAGVAFWSLAPRPSPPALSRLTIAPPAGLALYSDPVEHAISPDGRAIAYVTGDKISQAKNQIWIRTLDTLAPRRLADSDGGYLPFWSPDSRRVGFFSADAKLKTAPIDGDRADVICSVTNSRGGSWSPANVIVFAPDGSGPLFKVSANGGEPAPVTSLDASRQETGHRFPVFLPDGEHFLFAALPGKAGKFDIFAGSIAGGARELIGTMETSPEYAPAMPGLASGTGAAGWLIFMRQGALAAQAFDPARRKLVGEAITLPDVPGGLEDTATIWTTGQAASASRAGVLSYFTEPLVDTRLVYVDVAGALAPAPDLPNARYSGVSVSPDGSRAIVVRQTTRTESSLWQVDLLRGGVTPLAVGRGQQSGVVWSPDGRRIVYMSDRDGTENLFTWDIAAGGPESPFHQSPVPFKQPDDWSRDGKWVIFRQLDPGMFQNVWAMPAAAGAKPIPVVQRPGRDLGGRLSPDGRWIAYLSDDSGRSEVYLQPFPDSGGARVPVTTSGAGAVWWGADSRRLFVLDATFVRLLSIDIDFTSGPRPGPEKSVGVLPRGLRFLDLMPDRKRVLALAPAKVVEASITVVQNWELGLESRR
jgi:Tol biopolymer transport system component